MESAIEQIKSRLDLVEYIGTVVQVKKAGRNYKALCPFHQEKSPSFVISPERQIWHCFGSCGEGGDIIKFVMKYENLTFIEAVKELAEKAGVKVDNITVEDKVLQKKERLLTLNSLAAQYYEYLLHHPQFGKKSTAYLTERGLNESMMKTFQIGYAPQSWDSLIKIAQKRGYSLAELLEVGLVVKNQNGNIYDRFRGRIVFPLKDMRGHIIAFSGRLLDANPKEAKYINTPETELYHKRESLFGIQLAKEAIKKKDNVIIVEGEFDMILPYQYGIENIVAIKGSALTSEQLTILKRFTHSITLALDADSAGVEALKRGAIEAEKLEFELQVATFPFAKDPAEAVVKDLPAFKKIIAHPLPIYDFLIDVAQKKYPEADAYSKKKVGEDTIPTITSIKNPIIQSHYLKKIASILEVSEESIQQSMRKFERAKTPFVVRYQKPVKAQQNREAMLQKHLLSFIFQYDDPKKILDTALQVLSVDDFSYPALKKICLSLKDFLAAHETFNVKLFFDQLPAELQSVADELFLLSSTENEFSDLADRYSEESFQRLIYEIKKFAVKRQISQLLDIQGEEKNEEKLFALTRSLNEVEKKITSL